MGKKTNKKKGGKSKPKSREKNNPNRENEEVTRRRDTSRYAIYKYCTERVIDWGKSAYAKLNKTKNKSRQAKEESLFLESSLSRLIFQCLGTLAKASVPIPEAVLKDLQTAISYRQRVAEYYQSIPNVSQEAIASHEWLIVQLQLLESVFSQNVLREGGGTNTTRKVRAVETGFSVLALSDDEEKEDDSKVGENAAPDSWTSRKVRKDKNIPTDAELQEELRFFAIALILTQIADGRGQLKKVWKSWATSKNEGVTDDDDAANLLAATAATEYTLYAYQKLVMQAVVEFGEDVFDQILTAHGPNKVIETTTDAVKHFDIGDAVTIQNLQSRPDLNGKHGRVTKILLESEGRVAVELFPNDPKEYLNDNRKKSTSLSVKRGNLLLSDHLCLRLAQVKEALQTVPWGAVPEPPELTVNAPNSSSVHSSSMKLMGHFLDLQQTLKHKDFLGFLHLTVQFALPIWISMSRYLPDSGPVNTVLSGFLKEFDKKRRVDFHLALAMIVVVDSALAVYETGDGRAEDSLDIVDRSLAKAFSQHTYASAIRLFQAHQAHQLKAHALYSHLEFASHLRQDYMVMCSSIPLLTGEILSDGLRMAFVCSSGLPYAFVNEYTCMLHIYWMLRTEGFIGAIQEIEETLVSMYRQKVWFRAGLPQRGREAYVKSWQLSLGALNANSARLLDGKTTLRKGRQTALPKDLEMTGLHVTEISRLRDILQWKTLPIADVSFCHDQIQRVAREEYHSIYMAPLMSSSVKLMQVYEILGSPEWVARAEASGANMVANFLDLTQRMKMTEKVCFWGLALGDGRSLDPLEKPSVFHLMANVFRSCFPEDPNARSDGLTTRTPDSEPTLRFSSYTHDVDKSLWGEKGTQSRCHL